MKNIIKLNETQLKEIIKESVNAIINELNASTYLNAANQARDDAYGINSLPRGKKEIRQRQSRALRDYGLKKDRQEKGISDEDWNTYKSNNNLSNLSRRTLNACDAHYKNQYM